MNTTLRRLLPPFLGLVCLAAPSQATWSIVCVNLRTREVGVATATCLANLNLRRLVPVIVVGEGAAAAQSIGDAFGNNRRLIYFNYRDTEDTPAEILALLSAQDPIHQGRQYGIVNFTGDPVTFTGNGAAAAATGVTGQIGDWVYAVQGNILVGNEVVFAAESAFRNTHGDMGERLMAAMHAARDLGGDGRCSCSNNQPTSCGVPPPEPFKAAHIGCVVVARQGDANGGCNANAGCAKGRYYMSLNFIGGVQDPDPVFVLQDRYDIWRRNHLDAPDGLRSKVTTVQVMPADGVTQSTVNILLRDVDGSRLSHDDTRVSVKPLDENGAGASVGDVVNHGRGHYSFTLTAGTQITVERYVITAEARGVKATMYPYPEVEFVAPRALTVGMREVSAAAGARIPFFMNNPGMPVAPFWILGSWQGSDRRVGRLRRGLVALPLLPAGEAPFYPAAPLALNSRGRALAELSLPPGVLMALVGESVVWNGAILAAEGLELTNAVTTLIRP
jgi:hypothetical protein